MSGGQQSYERQQIAEIQLETALRLYFEGADFFSVLTLAGAAEEILGRLVEGRGGECSVNSLSKAMSRIHWFEFGENLPPKAFVTRANRTPNALKHAGGGDTAPVVLDIEEEAADMLDRAVTNYWTLADRLTPGMKRFEMARRNSSRYAAASNIGFPLRRYARRRMTP